ncbi:putative tail assembly protein [Achromobacter phage vB_AchrS_AchV4]|uniref:Putative tail assembly protein n=1 Tax=Achromobacter phage vB_AchrS_AchV4 TaxID=2796514 RepID=A0A7T3U6P4_9CAUD|nr:tail assembly chaperone [Achromobacter phage vB_AchrS_AchV4]QPZ53304.1 putative tail assembly protein [Achromobacter phage vB_AchrS_AchV4]
MNQIIDPRVEDLVIRVQDITATGHCVRGTKRWFEHYGFDFRRVLEHGIPAKDLLVTGDAQAIAVVSAKLAAMDEGE